MRKKRIKYILHEIGVELGMVLFPLLWFCMFQVMSNTVGAPGIILAFLLLLGNAVMIIRGGANEEIRSDR